MPFVILKQSILRILRVIFIDIWVSSSSEGKGELSHNNSGAITIKPSKVSLFLTIYTDSVFVTARWWLLASPRKELFSWGRISWSNFKNGKRPGLQLGKKRNPKNQCALVNKGVDLGSVKLWQIEGGKVEGETDFVFLSSKNHCKMGTAAMIVKDACSWEGKLWQT